MKKNACTLCRQSHTACDSQRPCRRCTTLGIPEQCQDGERKRLGRPPLARRHIEPLKSAKRTLDQPPQSTALTTRARTSKKARLADCSDVALPTKQQNDPLHVGQYENGLNRVLAEIRNLTTEVQTIKTCQTEIKTQLSHTQQHASFHSSSHFTQYGSLPSDSPPYLPFKSLPSSPAPSPLSLYPPPNDMLFFRCGPQQAMGIVKRHNQKPVPYVMAANEAFCELYGGNMSDINWVPLLHFIVRTDEGCEKVLGPLFRDKQNFSISPIITVNPICRRKDGLLYHSDTHFQLFYDENGYMSWGILCVDRKSDFFLHVSQAPYMKATARRALPYRYGDLPVDLNDLETNGDTLTSSPSSMDSQQGDTPCSSSPASSEATPPPPLPQSAAAASSYHQQQQGAVSNPQNALFMESEKHLSKFFDAMPQPLHHGHIHSSQLSYDGSPAAAGGGGGGGVPSSPALTEDNLHLFLSLDSIF